EDAVSAYQYVGLPTTYGTPVILDVLDRGTFNQKWDRVYVYRTATYNVSVPQHLQGLNSFYARVDATKFFRWSSFYLTRELGPDLVRKLLADHKDFQDSA